MHTNARPDVGLKETIQHLLDEAKEGIGERRAEKREPFFRPIRLSFARDERRKFSCFSRDISPTGIGLLHYTAMEPGEVVLTIPSESRHEVRIRSEIIWCQPCGEGWYLSGARFLDVVASS